MTDVLTLAARALARSQAGYAWHGRVLQDGLQVAKVTADDRASMLRELSHYAAMYAQDGPIILETRADKNRWRRHVP